MFNRTNSTPPRPEPTRRGTGRLGIAGAVVLLCTSVQALPDDAEQAMLVEADKGSYDDNPNGVYELSGNVLLEQGTLRVAADSVTASKRDGKLHRVVATAQDSEPARFRQQINPGEPFVEARAHTVDYAIAEERIELTGDAFLSDGNREFTGGVIVWDMADNRVSCHSGCRYKQIPRPASD